MDTYRCHGHFMSDPGSTYRTCVEISGMRKERDPIETIRNLVFAHDITTEKELKDIEKEVRKEVDEAIAKAKEIGFSLLHQYVILLMILSYPGIRNLEIV